MCPNFGHLQIINFPFGTMENLLFLGVAILKHITVVWGEPLLFTYALRTLSSVSVPMKFTIFS